MASVFYFRPGAEIFNGCRIGNFVEIKKSQIGEGTKVNHLSYIFWDIGIMVHSMRIAQ